MRPEQALRRITALIVQCCDPEAVLLFGSYAKGLENRDSDLDILVIADFQESPCLRGVELRDLLRRYAISIDLHLVTPEELAVETGRPHGFLSSVRASSVGLYQKAARGH